MSSGLYALKPRYARSLGGVRRRLAARGVSPNAASRHSSAARPQACGLVVEYGVAFGALAGVVLVAVAFRLAAAAGVPVVPVGLRGTPALLPKHGRVRRHRVRVRIGEAMAPDPRAARAEVARLAGHRIGEPA